MVSPLEPQLDMFSDLWWLFALGVLAALVGAVSKLLIPKRSGRRRRSRAADGRAPGQRSASVRRFDRTPGSSRYGKSRAQERFVSRTDSSPCRPLSGTLAGKAYVTDGDGIRVSGHEVRFAGLDAPEWDQLAKHRDGYWFRHGKQVKSALIRQIGGKQVFVTVEDQDKFGRAVGIVTCNGEDVGEWLVREGYAIAAYSNRYRHIEQEARRAKRGMWSHAVNIDPRLWRHRMRSLN